MLAITDFIHKFTSNIYYVVRAVILVSSAGFVTIVGYTLGLITILYGAFVCSAPFKYILHLAANSILGCIILSVANMFFEQIGHFVGINPITAVCVGVLGLPGTVAVILLSLII